jgi:Fe-S oxidoreductase
MAPLVAQTRRSMVVSEKMPPSAHDFALRDMAFANGEHCALLRQPPNASGSAAVSPAAEPTAAASPNVAAASPAAEPTAAASPNVAAASPATTAATTTNPSAPYLFYPGCQLAASEPGHVEAAYAYLREHLPEGVGLMLGCCGAPADWAGRDDLLNEGLAAIEQAWEQSGRPTFILACSSCRDVFARRLPQIPTLSLWQVVVERGLPDGVAGTGQALGIHDACSARKDPQTHEDIRTLVDSLGYQREELRYSREDAQCCGFGGLVLYANREQEEDFAADAAASSEHDLLVYCAMCKDLFAAQGKRCLHILDVLFAPDLERAASRRMPSLSERQDNRAALKRRLLEQVWGERQSPVPPRLPGYTLEIPPELSQLMEQRLILMADVTDALDRALQDPDECFFNPVKDSFLINIRKQFVTYWVEYRIAGTDIEVLSIYSHRMEVAG